MSPELNALAWLDSSVKLYFPDETVTQSIEFNSCCSFVVQTVCLDKDDMPVLVLILASMSAFFDSKGIIPSLWHVSNLLNASLSSMSVAK